MAMLTVYGDASGSGPDKPVISVGGFVSTVEQWTLFNEHWGRVLAKGPVDVYHAADLEAARGEFKGWKERRIEKFRTHAYEILSSYVAVGIATSLIKADFEDLKVRWHAIPQGKPANHYYFCVNDFIVNVSKWAKAHGYNSPINYVLERGDPGKGEVEKAFLEIAGNPEFEEGHLVGSISFLPKRCADSEQHKRLRPLQTADIWAYESYRFMMDKILPKTNGRPPRANTREGYRFLFKQEWAPYNQYWDKTTLPDFVATARKLSELD